MMDKIEILGLRDGEVKTVASIPCDDASHNTAIMGKDELVISVVTDSPLNLIAGDYVLLNGIKYRMNRDAELTQKSDVQHEYSILFEAPIYTLIDKIFCNKITGSTTVTLTGKLRDFLELLVWNVNYDAGSNPLGIDTGWEIGLCPDTDYMNMTLETVKCRDALDTFASKYGLEYYATNKTINYVSHIENETGLVFTQGKGGGLYEVEQKNVDDGDLVTRAYIKGGTDNVIPGEGDLQGRLVLPEGYIENFSESSRVVEAEVEFSDIHPTFQGTVGTVSGDNSREFLCPEMDFDIADVAVGDEARVNFLTGDLMGKSFEFKWDNSLKKITLIYQEDDLATIDNDTGKRPNIPSASKHLREGELFNFTGLKLSGTYKKNAITKLREKGMDWLAYYCQKHVKFELNVDYRFLRKNKTELHCGDLITINIPLHNISKLIRVTDIEKNLRTGKVTCTVSNYLDEKWEKKIEEQISDIQSSTTTVNGGYGGASSVTILEKNDEREASDSNVFSSLRTKAEIDLNNKSLEDKYLRKDQDDSTPHNLGVGSLTVGGDKAGIDKDGNLTTLNALIKALAKTHDLTVENTADIMKGIIREYLASESFVSGFLGNGFKIWKDANGDWCGEFDKLTVRKIFTVFELVVQKVVHQGGMVIRSAAGGKLVKVTDGGTYWKCEHDSTDDFVLDDQIFCQIFTGITIKRYWRKVTSAGLGYFNLSKADCEDGSAEPVAGDEVAVLGNRTNTDRQSAQIDCAVGANAPYRDDYKNINSYSLEGKLVCRSGNCAGIVDDIFGALDETINFYGKGVRLRGSFALESSGKLVEDEISGQISDVRTELEITAGQIRTKVQAATTAAAQAAGSASAAATSESNAAGSASQASGILASVTQKETNINQTANAIELKATRAETAAGRAESAEASINVKADGIVMQAAQTAINSVQVGGRNLIPDSISYWFSGSDYPTHSTRIANKLTITDDGAYNAYKTWIPHTDELVPGNTYTISMDVMCEGAFRGTLNLWFNFRIASTYYGSTSKQIDMSSIWKRVSATVTIPEGTSTVDLVGLVGFNGYGAKGLIINYKKIKLEYGNKAGDWTPAPEDVDASIALRPTTEYLKSQFTIALGGISLMGKTLSLAGMVTFSSLDSSAQSTINGKATKTEAQGYANAAADAIQIGGDNKYSNIYTSIGEYNGVHLERNNSAVPNGLYLIGRSTYDSWIRFYNVITEGGWWTVSFYMRGSQSANVGFTLDICDIGAFVVRTNTDNQWHYYSYTINVTNYTESTYNFVDFSSISWAYIFIKDLKIEHGNKATPWTPNYLDIRNDAQSKANTAKENLATSLGYSSYSAMEAQAVAGRSIINGAYINTGLLAARAITADKIAAGTITATEINVNSLQAALVTAAKIQSLDITTNKLTVTNGSKLGDFTIKDGLIKSTNSISDVQATSVELSVKGLSTSRLNGGVSGVRVGDFSTVINGVSTPVAVDISALGGYAINAQGAVRIDLGPLYLSSGTTIEGFSTKTLKTYGNIYPKDSACFISCTSTSYVYLPPSPYVGREIYVCRRAHASVTVYNNSGPYICRSGTSILSSFFINNDGEIWLFKYDGEYWVTARLDT